MATNAIQDQNQVYSLLAASGTAGTAEPVRLVATEAGALNVDIISGEIIASLGTVDLLKAGTITSLETNPIHASKVNASLVLSYDASNNLGTITKTIGTVSYIKTLSWGTTGLLGTVSSWSQV